MAKTPVFGIDKLRTGLAVAVTTQRKDLAIGLRAMAEALALEIQAACPVGSGALRDSIKIVETGSANRPGFEVWIGDRKIDYAAHVEYGTSRMPAQPFVRPVAYREDSAENFPAAIEQT
jgi:HK97 gp10 family phage protein